MVGSFTLGVFKLKTSQGNVHLRKLKSRPSPLALPLKVFKTYIDLSPDSTADSPWASFWTCPTQLSRKSTFCCRRVCERHPVEKKFCCVQVQFWGITVLTLQSIHNLNVSIIHIAGHEWDANKFDARQFKSKISADKPFAHCFFNLWLQYEKREAATEL